MLLQPIRVVLLCEEAQCLSSLARIISWCVCPWLQQQVHGIWYQWLPPVAIAVPIWKCNWANRACNMMCMEFLPPMCCWWKPKGNRTRKDLWFLTETVLGVKSRYKCKPGSYILQKFFLLGRLKVIIDQHEDGIWTGLILTLGLEICLQATTTTFTSSLKTETFMPKIIYGTSSARSKETCHSSQVWLPTNSFWAEWWCDRVH